MIGEPHGRQTATNVEAPTRPDAPPPLPHQFVRIIEEPWRARAIWRFELPITDRHTIDMPRDSKVVAVAASRHDPQGLELWAAVDPGRELVPRAFLVVGTGHPIPEGVISYHGMAQTHGGALVWHVLESAR